MDPRAAKFASTFEEDILRIHEGRIIPLGPYIGNHKGVKCKCKKCDFIWSPSPSSLKQGHGCPKCSIKSNANKVIAILASTFEEDILRIHKGRIKLLGPYKSAKEKVKCLCNVCQHIWQATPDKLKQGSGCPPCGIKSTSDKRAAIAASTFEEEIKRIHKGKITLLSPYKSAREKVEVRCERCRHIWSPNADSLKQVHGCPKCKFEKLNSIALKKSAIVSSTFLADIERIHHGKIQILSEYEKSTKKVRCLCKVCKKEWIVTPKNLKKGSGCPNCAEYGFDQTKPANLYLNLIELQHGKRALKYGITNNDVGERLKKQKRHIMGSIKNISVWHFKEGKKASECERKILETFPTGYLNLAEMKDGYSETLEYSEENIQFIEDLVEKYLS